MRKKFEFRKLSKVKEEVHDKEIVKNPDVLKNGAAAENIGEESTNELTKDTAHKPRGNYQEQLDQLEEQRLHLLSSLGTTHRLVAEAARPQKEKCKTNQYGERQVSPIVKKLVVTNILLPSSSFERMSQRRAKELEASDKEKILRAQAYTTASK